MPVGCRTRTRWVRPGKTVKPTIYIAAGISGATQHMVGMKSAKNIIAVNKDQEAPIFSIADLGIVGDVNKVLPKLIEALRQRALSRSGVGSPPAAAWPTCWVSCWCVGLTSSSYFDLQPCPKCDRTAPRLPRRCGLATQTSGQGYG